MNFVFPQRSEKRRGKSSKQFDASTSFPSCARLPKLRRKLLIVAALEDAELVGLETRFAGLAESCSGVFRLPKLPIGQCAVKLAIRLWFGADGLLQIR